MSVTNATIDAWLQRKRGMQCTPPNVPQVCLGDRVMYTDKRTQLGHMVTVVNIGPLVLNARGHAEPASITVQFENGRERNTTLLYITPLARTP